MRALIWVGLAYGFLLAATHQLRWDRAFEDDPPRLGGNLEGELSPGVEELVLRSLSVASSLAVGLGAGVVGGFVARALLRSRGPDDHDDTVRWR